MSPPTLGPAFLAAAPGASAPLKAEALESALAAYVQAARAPWPELELDALEFVRYAAERTPAGQLPLVAHAAELWLACACALGAPRAVEVFQREYAAVIGRVLGRRKAAEDLADEVRQLLSEKLLVGSAESGRAARIGEYKAQGPLKSWVATAAATTLSTLRRTHDRRREEPEPAADLAWDGRLDPELEYLKRRYAAELQAALVAALESLGDRDKTLLRLHLGERLSIDVIGSMYGVNRATAARWLATARKSVLDSARTQLSARLALSESECDSLVALAFSRLDVSLLQHLAPPAPPA
jgi:RNA polymerase sigma-70 factor, ECF subfamily